MEHTVLSLTLDLKRSFNTWNLSLSYAGNSTNGHALLCHTIALPGHTRLDSSAVLKVRIYRPLGSTYCNVSDKASIFVYQTTRCHGSKNDIIQSIFKIMGLLPQFFVSLEYEFCCQWQWWKCPRLKHSSNCKRQAASKLKSSTFWLQILFTCFVQLLGQGVNIFQPEITDLQNYNPA